MQRAVAVLILLIAMCACCANHPRAAPSALFSAHHPERVRLLAPIDRVGADNGVALVRDCVEKQLERRGYRTERSGRTATLHVVIERWGRVADGSGGGGTACVELPARLYDDATGALIWDARGRSGCEPDEDFDEDEGWLERMIAGLFDWVVDWLSDDVESAGESAVHALLRSLPRRADSRAALPTPEWSDASTRSR